jgi:2-polyprenyl-3-methyl-5-hydroxy-6-metoxy-1,4-benzoquinol methylase
MSNCPFPPAAGAPAGYGATVVEETGGEMPNNAFVSGEYLQKIPQWHTEDSAWKAKCVLQMLERNHLSPRTIADVGCGAGEVLRQLQVQMDPQCLFLGYDISPQAIELSRSRENHRLHFHLTDTVKEPDTHFDLLLVLDVLEHQENYFSFLRNIKRLASYTIFHTVLDLSVYTVLQKNGLTKRRRLLEDLHFFTKDTALQILNGEKYEILDWFYAPRSIYRSTTITDKIRQLPRALCFAIHKDFAVRFLGGYTLFVLAK